MSGLQFSQIRGSHMPRAAPKIPMPIAMVRIKRPAAIANLPGAGVRFSVWRNKRDVVENGDSHPINVVTGRFFEKVVILCTQDV
jgi:hypothetical protein